jgi:HD-GYP domain-containing protein (c-di-GMP phosphodiesterase class II)
VAERENTEGICSSVREEGLLIRLLDGELDANQEHMVLTHLRTCADCLSLAANVLYMDSRVRDILDVRLSENATPEVDEKKSASTDKGFRLEVDKLPVGKEIDRDLIDEDGKLLIAAGTQLTPAMIDSLKKRGIEKLSVRQSEKAAAPVAPKLPELSFSVEDYKMVIADSGVEPAISEYARKKVISTVRDSFRSLESSGVFDLKEADDAAIEVANEVLNRPQVALTLADLELHDKSLYTHSVNVLVLFLSIARAMGHPAQLIKDHATAALLHDIGRIVLRRSDIAVGRKRSKDEEDLEHTEAGYTYLWNMGGVGDTALRMVMNHHERYDGNGYPRGLKGTNLSDWDQLLILTNTYDNLTWDRETGIRSGFHNALSTLIQESGKYVRKGIIRAVIQTIGHYPPGSFVTLNSGEVGVVTQSHPGSPLKPMVSILYGTGGDRLSKSKKLDLSQIQSAYIKGPAKVSTTT